MRNDIKMTDSDIEDLFDKAFRVLITADSITWTRDSIEDFIAASNSYAEAGKVYRRTVDGLPTVMIESCQVRRGDPRRDVHIIDFGFVRGVYA